MTTFTIGRWLLVALAVVALAVAAPAVGAHGTDSTADDAPPENGTADDRAAWMAAHMTDHAGPGSVEWMESHAGVTVDEMAREMADDDHHRGSHDGHDRRMGGQGHGC